MKAVLRAIFQSQPLSQRNKAQILSDLHLEVGQQYLSFEFRARAPFLILAGDIGRLIDYDAYLKFLEKQARRFEKVFLILGNHEFYGLDYRSGIEKAQCLAQGSSVSDRLILLNQVRWDDPNSSLTIIGCTLWSSIPDEAVDIVESKISDFKMIEGWTAKTHNEVHTEEAAWLREQAVQAGNDVSNGERHILIATHHAPCVEGTSAPEYSSTPWSSAFVTDMLGQQGWDGVKVWVFGHTHWCTDMLRNGIRLVANQRGYVFPGSVAHKQETKHKRPRADSHEFDAEKVITL